jgi:multidrug efflux pump subunit AcrA (membrane-fusion protein)
LVKAGIKADDGVYPGMFGRLLIPIGTTEKMYVPRGAVIRVGQLDFVLVPSGGATVRRYVRLGSGGDGELIEVRSGLKPGDTVMMPSSKS